MTTSVLALTKQLIECISVTPSDGGSLAIIEACLVPSGFHAEYFNHNDVKNLYLTYGETGPLIVFLGHVDVVPSGPLTDWTHPPFQATEHDGYLYGRGSADMKSAVAAFVVALQNFVHNHPRFHGRLGLLLTSDEEGASIDGIRHVMQVLQNRGEHIDYCLVGEPSSQNQLGDTIKVGRRGSLSAQLTILGKQGHVAYPNLAINPIHNFAPVLQALVNTVWDQGQEPFAATSCQFSTIYAGTGASNIIPGQLTADFNFRYSPALSATDIQSRVEKILQEHQVTYDIVWRHSGLPFFSNPGALLAACQHAIKKITQLTPQSSTIGGTSDGRFVAPTGSEVIEVGLVNKTIHQIDECVKISDLEPLCAIYSEILTQLCLPLT